MKVALVRPCWYYPITYLEATYNRIWFPLSLANAAALLLQEGIEVKVVDAQAERLRPEEVARRISGADKVFITSSGLDRWQCPNTDIRPFLDVTRAIREVASEVYVMGYHGTVFPKEVLEFTSATGVIRGEPEKAVLEISRKQRLAEIAGVTFRSHGDGEIINTPLAEPLDLSSLPIPAYGLFPLKRYFYEILGRPFVLFEATRGCPFGCIFCAKVMYGTRIRKKPTSHFLKEVDTAITRYGVKTGYFFDLEFTLDRDFVMEVSRYLAKKDYDFRWCCQTRADKVDGEILEAMRKAGCRLIHSGIETGSQRIMKLINKGATLQALEEGVRLIKKSGIEVLLFFMFGFPSETREDMEATIEIAKRLGPTYAAFHFAIPYPGTKFAEMMGEPGIGEADPAQLFPEVFVKEHSLDFLKKMVRRGLKEFYLRPRYILDRMRYGRLSSLPGQLRLFLSYFR
ncbi:MAG: hypothetical protein AMS15_00810 [Planctomycetes bacterium DG_23]|nr:MAG: hypothetical protein AMS15_00810 [Planctomycetes bacterium DG_23]